VAEVRLRTVNAFTDKPFTGNPAAVVVLDEAPPDEWMAAVARETNVSDTGFVIHEKLSDADFRLRWFTPAVEVDLCGHATFASAHCLFEDGVSSPIRFATRSGVLTSAGGRMVRWRWIFRRGRPLRSMAGPQRLRHSARPWSGRAARTPTSSSLRSWATSVRSVTWSPDLTAVGRLDASAVIVTAAADPGQGYDFVSRLFAPNAGIPEDPVTGSSHTVLAPFWAVSLTTSRYHPVVGEAAGCLPVTPHS
jgi:predicted PhzF superfamily epimerase YddE/YHI9